MVRASRALHLKDAGAISKALLDILVCPLSKQPFRYCHETQSLISDAIGVSFPVSQSAHVSKPRNSAWKKARLGGSINNGSYTNSGVVRNVEDSIKTSKEFKSSGAPQKTLGKQRVLELTVSALIQSQSRQNV